MKYRIYADGSIENEDNFFEVDNAQPYHDDYEIVIVLDTIVQHIENEAIGK